MEPAKNLGVDYEEQAIVEILKWSQGYPFFIQELCKTVWEYTEKDSISLEDVERMIAIFPKSSDDNFFRIRYERCTKKVYDFLFAMARCGVTLCTISNVAHVLKKRVNSISSN